MSNTRHSVCVCVLAARTRRKWNCLIFLISVRSNSNSSSSSFHHHHRPEKRRTIAFHSGMWTILPCALWARLMLIYDVESFICTQSSRHGQRSAPLVWQMMKWPPFHLFACKYDRPSKKCARVCVCTFCALWPLAWAELCSHVWRFYAFAVQREWTYTATLIGRWRKGRTTFAHFLFGLVRTFASLGLSGYFASSGKERLPKVFHVNVRRLNKITVFVQTHKVRCFCILTAGVNTKTGKN